MKLYRIIYLLCLSLVWVSYSDDLYESLSSCKTSSVAEKYTPARSLKILICVRTFPKLSETFVVNQIIGLLGSGHRIAIYAERKEDTDKFHQDIQTYNLLERVYYNELPEDIASYDIILGEFGTLGAKMLKIKKDLGLEAKLVTFFRGFDITSYLAKKPHLYDDLFIEGDFFLTNCEHFKKRLIRLGVSPERILVNYSSINGDRFAYKERHPNFEKEIRLITTGRLVEKKGIADALNALTLLIDGYPHITYHIAGDGPLKHVLEKRVHELGLDDVVTFSGPYSSEELPGLLDNADIFLGPSVTAQSQDQDAIPNTLKEAMATGLPVVATNHGGIPEMIQHGVNGLLVEEHDPQGLADSITYLIEHPERAVSLGRAARQTIEEQFELKNVNNELGCLIANLAD